MEQRYPQYAELIARFSETNDETHLLAAFHLLDLDGDGFISKSELLEYYKAQELEDDAQLISAGLFRMGDTNRDGHLDEREFVEMINQALSLEDPDIDKADSELSPQDLEFKRLLEDYERREDPSTLETLFSVIDTDGDGVVSKAELRNSYIVRKSRNESAAANFLMGLGDLNDDGVLSREEFRKLVKGWLFS